MEMKLLNHNNQPMWNLAITLPLLYVMISCAGAVFSSTQDMSFGDMLTTTVNYPHALAAKLLGYYAVALLLIAVIAPSYRGIVHRFKENYLIASILLLALASFIWSQDPLFTLKCAFWLFLSISFTFWIITNLSGERQMQLLMITGAVAAMLSIFVVILLPSAGLDRLHNNVWQGIFQSKNHMGRIFLFLLTPAIHYSSKSVGGAWIKWPYICLMFFLIVMSGSRGAWMFTIAYMFLALILWQASKMSGNDKPIVIGIIGLSLLILCFLVAQNYDALLLLFGRDSSISGRATIWKVLMTSVGKRPLLGFGYQAFWAGTSSEAMNALVGEYGSMHFLGSYTHSGYLSVLLENGFVGLGLIVVLIVKSVKDSWICIHRKQTPFINWYIGIVFLTIIYNIDEVTFMLPNYLPWMMFLLASASLHAEVKRIRLEGRA